MIFLKLLMKWMVSSKHGILNKKRYQKKCWNNKIFNERFRKRYGAFEKKFPSSFTNAFDFEDPVRVRFEKLQADYQHLLNQLDYLKLLMCSLAIGRVGIDDRRLQAFAESKGYPTFPAYVETLKKNKYMKHDPMGRNWYMPNEDNVFGGLPADDFGGLPADGFGGVEDIISTARKM